MGKCAYCDKTAGIECFDGDEPMMVCQEHADEYWPIPRPPCIGNDPLCPCQDGDVCHYVDWKGTKAMPIPHADPTDT